MKTPQEKVAQTKEQKRLAAEKKKQELEQQQIAEENRESQKLIEGAKMKGAYNMLLSEVTGLYDEMDKLAKKAPSEPMTKLQLKIVNSFTRKAKHLLAGDAIIDEIEIFVSAGDNPEYRDVVTVLRQIRQGLERFRSKNSFIFGDSFNRELATWDFGDEKFDDFFADLSDSKYGTTE